MDEVGRDSILLQSISLNEKQAKALYKAPGLLGRTKTIEVLDGIFGGKSRLTGYLPNNKNLVKLLSLSSIF